MRRRALPAEHVEPTDLLALADRLAARYDPRDPRHRARLRDDLAAHGHTPLDVFRARLAAREMTGRRA